MNPPPSLPMHIGVIASLLTAAVPALAPPAVEAGQGGAPTRRLTDHQALAGAAGLAPCAAGDLDCRAFTGTLAWRPDEARPLLSSKSLRRLALLRHLPGGQRERGLRCLAFIAWAEARSDGIEGMRAVIVAVLNRARDPAFLNHPCATVGQPGAFEPMAKHEHMPTVEALRQGRLPPFPRPVSVIDLRALEIAQLLAFRMAHAAEPRDPTCGATHFLAPRVLAQRGQAMPAWTRRLERTACIKGHRFYRGPVQGRPGTLMSRSQRPRAAGMCLARGCRGAGLQGGARATASGPPSRPGGSLPEVEELAMLPWPG